ncbi:MAG: tRNA threonylcarbamoyladenosine dehydratase [Eubacteriales bacterium]|nr:tRNA threonylcarbamoyladenosine dehydratase [Eubacteriales bacterium]
MMEERLQRLELLFGRDALEALARKRVAVFGLGGVGGIAAQALARSGVGHLLLVDGDTVDVTNLNRQAVARASVLGQPKAAVMARDIADMAPGAEVEAVECFFHRGDAWQPRWDTLDYVLDAIDDVNAKVELICRCREHGVPVISSMGAGNRLDPMAFSVMDISRTQMDPLARVMRRKLKDVGVERGVLCVCSSEKPMELGQRTPGSFMPVVSAAGLLLAAQVVKELAGLTEVHNL